MMVINDCIVGIKYSLFKFMYVCKMCLFYWIRSLFYFLIMFYNKLLEDIFVIFLLNILESKYYGCFFILCWCCIV